MKDKEKLKKLVQIIGDLLKVEGNEWLIDEILKTIGKNSTIDQIANHSLIQEIHEYCIKKNIEKQAEEFYKMISINDKEKLKFLEYDFIEMENNRRRDHFYEFSFCLNQQIEGLTNYLFDNIFHKEWQILDDTFKNITIEDYETEGKRIKNTLQDIIIEKKKENEPWSDLNKFKLVYFFLNKSGNFKLPFDFKRMRDLKQEISIARNESHRGSNKFEWQENILKTIKGNESKYYFKFYGFLQEFVTSIEHYYKKNASTNINNSKKETKKISTNNTLGNNSPILAKLKEQMENNKNAPPLHNNI